MGSMSLQGSISSVFVRAKIQWFALKNTGFTLFIPGGDFEMIMMLKILSPLS